MARPITVQVGPLTAPSANNIGTAQKAAGAQALVINGSTSDAAATAVCASQTPSGAGALTINGTMANSASGSAVAYFASPRRVYITSAGNDSARTFTIVGTLNVISGPPVYVTETVTGANTSTVSTTKLFSSVTSVTISGSAAAAVTVGMNGVATLDTGRRVLFTPAGADSGITYTITGTDWSGNTISETLAGVDNPSTTYTLLDYKTITGITISGAAASTLTIGTNGIASSPWVRMDNLGSLSQVGVQCAVSGTINYTVQETFQDPNEITNTFPPNTTQVTRASTVWSDFTDSAVVAATATKVGITTNTPAFCRLTVNSNTNPAYVSATFIQNYLS